MKNYEAYVGQMLGKHIVFLLIFARDEKIKYKKK